MKSRSWKLLLALAALGGLAGLSAAAGPGADAPTAPPTAAPPTTPAEPIDFARDVYPLLRRACFECHGPDKQKGELRLDTRPLAFHGGSGGPAIVPGKPGESELIRRVMLPKGSDEVMPARGDPLSRAEVDTLRAWVQQGAPWPEGKEAAAHWAYVKPTRPAPPAVRNASWPRNAIDRFVLARLEREGLRPSPEAGRATLIRRASLDLTGLPPTPAEVDAFVADQSPDAYEKVVDRLLASPQFGERWARPWLDLARYADSHGFQRDDLRDSWAYRDWVIKALNADMPFDRFTIEQVAGDLLPNATIDQRIATGFNRCAPTNVEAGSEPEETRVNQVFDRVNTVGAVWLGATLECAQCHDHKFDPISQADYYRLFAFFNNTALEADRANPTVPGSIRFLGPTMALSTGGMGAAPEAGPAQENLPAALRRLDRQLQARREKLAAELGRWEAEAAASLAKRGEDHVLAVAGFESSAGSPHKVLEDGSVLLVDDPPEKDTYTVTVRTKLTGITGFRLDALTDPSLPGEGPGRGDKARPNFVLHAFEVKAAPAGGGGGGGGAGARTAHPVKLTRPQASYSQAKFDVAGAIDGDPKTAWAINPQFHKPHWATFDTDKPIGFADGTTLTFTLDQQFGGGRTIGRLRLTALTGDRSAGSVPGEVAAALRTPKDERTPAQTTRLLDYRLEQDEAYARLKAQRDEAAGGPRKGAPRPPTTLVMQELPQTRPSAIFVRGSFRDPGSPVQPGTPAALHKMPDGGPADRLALARWLVDRQNPLAARVTVNRWWAEIFGQGIVATVEDFGIKGEPPTHPDLLDWLAVEFMEPSTGSAHPSPGPAGQAGQARPWSMKHVLRQVVLSATYRQSSHVTPALRERDDQNRLYARGPRLRMDAEMIRDNALAAAGLLSRKQFGPPVRPYQPDGLWVKVGGERVDYVTSPGEDRHRRGIYVVWKRGAPYPSFVNFDATARLACTVKRSRSNTPLQALTLLNDPVYVEAAVALAHRVVTEKPSAGADERIAHAFRLCLSRAPSDREAQVLRKLYDAQREAAKAGGDAGAAVKELFAGVAVPDGTAPEELSAWYAVAAALLNLDETITKG